MDLPTRPRLDHQEQDKPHHPHLQQYIHPVNPYHLHHQPHSPPNPPESGDSIVRSSRGRSRMTGSYAQESATAAAIEQHGTFKSPAYTSAWINPSSSHLHYFPQQQQRPHHFLSPCDGQQPSAPSSSPNNNNNIMVLAAASTRGRRPRDTSRAVGSKQHELALNKQRRSAYLFRARERHVSSMLSGKLSVVVIYLSSCLY